MDIRRATQQDIEEISRLLYQVAAVHHRGRPDLFKAGGKKYTDEELAEVLTDESRPVFVGIRDGKVAAHLFCVITDVRDNGCLCDRKTLYIDDLCVDENTRGQHIGAQMYEFIKEYAREIGCYNVTLNVWSCNADAMRFYEKMGLLPQKIGMEEIL